jgi:hypothetical protein
MIVKYKVDTKQRSSNYASEVLLNGKLVKFECKNGIIITDNLTLAEHFEKNFKLRVDTVSEPQHQPTLSPKEK